MSYAYDCAKSLNEIARRSPQIHCITNAVAMAYTANLLLAVGATPTMSMALDEIGDLVAKAGGLSINIGTLDIHRRDAIETAIAVATQRGVQWVLDPVLADRSSERCHYAARLVSLAPAVIRGNATEIAALAGQQPPHAAAASLACSTGSIVVQTGAIDIITDGQRVIHIANGHAMMTRVTGMGCAASALIGAFLAVAGDPLKAAVQAMLAVGVAGELAGALAPGPGTLQVKILDNLYALHRVTLESRARVTEVNIHDDNER